MALWKENVFHRHETLWLNQLSNPNLTDPQFPALITRFSPPRHTEWVIVIKLSFPRTQHLQLLSQGFPTNPLKLRKSRYFRFLLSIWDNVIARTLLVPVLSWRCFFGDFKSGILSENVLSDYITHLQSWTDMKAIFAVMFTLAISYNFSENARPLDKSLKFGQNPKSLHRCQLNWGENCS